jgi:hypothetical protein
MQAKSILCQLEVKNQKLRRSNERKREYKSSSYVAQQMAGFEKVAMKSCTAGLLSRSPKSHTQWIVPTKKE